MTPRRREVEALEASLGDKVMALDGRVGALQATELGADVREDQSDALLGIRRRLRRDCVRRAQVVEERVA